VFVASDFPPLRADISARGEMPVFARFLSNLFAEFVGVAFPFDVELRGEFFLPAL